MFNNKLTTKNNYFLKSLTQILFFRDVDSLQMAVNTEMFTFIIFDFKVGLLKYYNKSCLLEYEKSKPN